MGPCDPPGTPYMWSLGSEAKNLLQWLPVEVALTLTAYAVVYGVVGVLDCCGCRCILSTLVVWWRRGTEMSF